MNQVINSVNPEMVTLGRESRGLTQSELAKCLHISQARLSKIESGHAPVTDDLLLPLVSCLEYPLTFFLRSDPVFGPGTSEFFHRRRQSVGNKLLTRLHAILNIRRMEIARLLRSVELPENNIPRYDPDSFDGSVEEIARAVRAAWNLPRGPIKNLTRVIEEAGGIVVPIDLISPKIDAVTRHIPGLPPLFFINPNMPGDRQRLSLAHELGHAVMHSAPHPEMEEQAFLFANEFLMPAREINQQLDYVTLPKLASLKPYWRVSMQAILKWAHELGRVTDNQARYLWMQIGKAGYRKREPAELDIEPERPEALRQIVELHRSEFGYSADELSELVGLTVDEVQVYYGVQKTPAEARASLRVLGGSAQEA